MEFGNTVAVHKRESALYEIWLNEHFVSTYSFIISTLLPIDNA